MPQQTRTEICMLSSLGSVSCRIMRFFLKLCKPKYRIMREKFQNYAIFATCKIQQKGVKIFILPRDTAKLRWSWESQFCLSVCRTRVFWQNQIMHCGYFDTTRKDNHSFSDTNSGWWATPPFVWNLRSKWPIPFENADFDRVPLITSQL